MLVSSYFWYLDVKGVHKLWYIIRINMGQEYLIITFMRKNHNTYMYLKLFLTLFYLYIILQMKIIRLSNKNAFDHYKVRLLLFTHILT